MADNSVIRFWGSTIAATTPLKLALTGTELHVTQAVLVGGKRATLWATTDGVPPVALVVLTAAAPNALLDVCFFDEDEAVTLRVEGEGASVAISGSICVQPPPEDEDGEEAEGEEEEEEGAAADAGGKRKATFVEQADDADEDEVRAQERSRAAPTPRNARLTRRAATH